MMQNSIQATGQNIVSCCAMPNALKFVNLANGTKVEASEFERILELNCHYVKAVIVTGEGKDYPVAIVFANSELFSQPDYLVTPLDGCFCPRNLAEFSRCLTGCIRLVNNELDLTGNPVRKVAIISSEAMSLSKINGAALNLLVEDIYTGNTQAYDGIQIIQVNKSVI